MRRASSFAVGLAVLAVAGAQPLAAQVISYTNEPLFAGAAGSTTVLTFESFTAGTILTTQLAAQGIALVAGTDPTGTIPLDVKVGTSASLPFGMFTPGLLPSETHFISIDMVSAGAHGSIFLNFAAPTNAVGGYITDNSPLGGFVIELFNGAISLGSTLFGAQNLPNSFVGVTSVSSFTSARLHPVVDGDSWGIDNLEFGGTVATPEPGTITLFATGLLAIGGMARRRRANRA